ncbi:replication factor A protein 3 [Clavulina sp. PMI_390]|nr:replication factor A protein 3 [Clavulina sp. PMI_390]
MQTEITARVNGAMLPKFIGKTLDAPNEAVVEAADGGQVKLKLNASISITTNYVEVIGTVQDASLIKVLHASNLGDGIDLTVVNGLIELAAKHPQIFADV